MATIILGQHADALTVRLTEGDGADLVATLVDSTGAEVDWTAAPTLSFAHSVTRDVIAEHTATIAGPVATWDLTRTDIDDIATGSLPRRAGQLYTYARITTPDTGDTDGHVEYAGKVDWRDGWTAGDRSQRVTFTLPGVPGPAGPPRSGGGGSDVLNIVNGGTVTLDDTKPEGTIVGYRVKATATFEGEGGVADLEPGAYTFERTDTGWVYYAATGTALTSAPVSGWATLATDNFTAPDGTPVVGRTTTTGGLIWLDESDGSPVTIQGNRGVFVGSGYAHKLRLPLGGLNTGVRISFDYDFTAGGTTVVSIAANWKSTGVMLTGTGQLISAGEVPPNPGIAGTLSGHPKAGRFGLEALGSAMTVYINDVAVATGTMSEGLAGDYVIVNWDDSGAKLDNVTIETYS